MIRRMSNKAKRVLSDSRKQVAAKKAKTKLIDEDESVGEKSPYFGKGAKINVGDVEDLGSEMWKPNNWEKTLENIREMRKNKDAPVDTMGCDRCMDTTKAPEVIRFQALVSLMLSSQTKDEVVFAAMERLKNYKTGLDIDSVLKIPEETLAELIKPAGFYSRKSKFIKQTAKILKDQFKGDIPNSVELLCSLPGVGPKMAHLCMKTAWGVISGIGVDTHVHRISNRIGWVKNSTKQPEQTRTALESWLPRNLWEEVNGLFVGFGQQVCKSGKPLCDSCLNQPICPFGNQKIIKQ